MGVRHRKKRAHEKRLARWFGVQEDELGRLRKRMTKSQARRQLIMREAYRQKIENEIIDAAIKKATDDICAIEDAAFLSEIDQLLGPTIREVVP